jgi:tripartite-type tricarboxylate transporter receptor subunit TctC
MTRLSTFVAAVAFALLSPRAAAQGWPTQTVKIVVPLSTGSASDAFTRIVAQKLSDMWGQPVVVENAPGANGIPATTQFVRAAPDGYTLFTMSTNQVINASLYRSLPFDTLKDLKPIVRIGFTPLLLCVYPGVPANDLKELLALAKAKPGKLNYGSAGSGSATHLAGELFKTMAGINIQHIPYKAVSQGQADLLGGQLDLMFVVPSFAIPQINAGKLRALGVASLNRMPQLPQLPTIDEQGVPGFDAFPWVGFAGPAGLPDDIVAKVSADTIKVLAMPDVQEKITGIGLVIAAMPTADFTSYAASELAKYAKIVRDSGARAD